MERETFCRSLMNSEENPIHLPENTGILLTDLANRVQWLVGVRTVALHEYARLNLDYENGSPLPGSFFGCPHSQNAAPKFHSATASSLPLIHAMGSTTVLFFRDATN
jgi:hypothetical protein